MGIRLKIAKKKPKKEEIDKNVALPTPTKYFSGRIKDTQHKTLFCSSVAAR